MKRYEIINTIIAKYDLKTYLEIGVRTGTSFNNVVCEDKESVDPSWEPTHKMTSDEFFAINKKKYDIIFIDGLHEHHQVYRDIMNSLDCLNEGGFIVLHDCNPPTESHTDKNINGTVYKGFIQAKQELDCNCFVVDADWGCGIITKRKLKRDFKPTSMRVSWDVFKANRYILLDLITIKDFLHAINYKPIKGQ